MTPQLELINELQSLPFKNDILNHNGMIYCVGGRCRDSFLGYESKDLDIMITRIEPDKLKDILTKYGTVDLVGNSFGIIKFKAFGSQEDIDISLPRRERLVDGERGHKAFDVVTDPFLPIELDLRRRDIRINSIAIDIHGNIYDPFNGISDIINKEINVTDSESFFDDPLRLLRIIGFASRFNFSIENETFKLIQENAHRIKEISPERILTELDKIVKKGDIVYGAQLLIETNLYKFIFDTDELVESSEFYNVTTLGEFVYLFIRHKSEPTEYYLDKLKGDINTGKEIKALHLLLPLKYFPVIYYNKTLSDIHYIAYTALTIYPHIIKSKLFSLLFIPFKSGEFPKSRKEIAINGNEIMEYGFQGEEIKVIFDKILYAIFDMRIKNESKDIHELIKNLK